MRIYSLVLACFTLLASSAWAQCDNLFFSEAAEGSSNNKYLEIYNPTSETVDLSDYAYPNVSNAPNVVGEYEYWNAFADGATVAPGDVYIIAHPSADPLILAVADETFTFLSNGDDGFMLVQGDEMSFVQIDAVGDWNGDPGSGWDVAGVSAATKDHTLVRKSSVQDGNAGDWVTSAGTSEEDSEWIVLDQNDWSNLASHSFDGCGAPVPGCTNENAVNYNADATEDDGSCIFDNACNVDGVEVEASSFQYVPSSLSVAPGTTVTWTNMGGTHDVNGDIDSQTGLSFGNPEAFYIAAVSGNASGVCIGSYTFNTPGVYTYDCSIGSHAALGMVATITVGTGGCTNAAAPNYNPSANFDDGSCIEVSTTSIADIQLGQETEVFTDSVVVTSGIVTGVFGSNVSIQDGQGAYSGMWLYAPDVPVMVGDAIEATGAVVEYFGKTQIGNPAVVITSQGNDLPTPEMLTTLDASAEAWEGVLIQVTGSVTNADLGFGEWALSDGSGDLAVDDAGYDAIAAGVVAADNQLQVTGVLDYSFGTFKVQLRDAIDALLYGCAVEGAANYNDLASIDDGSCVYEGGECGLFFSEMAEGSSNNKYIELYNPTLGPIFLSEYALGNCGNGCDVTGELDYYTSLPADAVVEAGSTYIIAHPFADSLILAEADMTFQYLSNGDDAFALLDITGESPVIVDVFGSLGADPGSGFAVAGVVNATQNATLVRKPTISQGNAGDWAISAGTNEIDSEWVINPSDDWTNLGIHTFQGACAVDNSGCTDSGAVNYDPTATEDDGSCIFIPNLTIQEIQTGEYEGAVVTSGVVTGVFEGIYDLGNQPSYVLQNGDGPSSGIWVIGQEVAVGDFVEVSGNVTEVYGLRQIQGASPTVLSSGNMLPAPAELSLTEVNMEQWECVLAEMTGTASSIFTFGQWYISDSSGEQAMVARLGYDALSDSSEVDGTIMPIVELGRNYRITGPNFFSFDNWKLCPRDSADVVRIGCTNSTFPNFDPLAIEDDESCLVLEGCTDDSADNYNPEANVDDGSCVVTGCTDPTALNFNENTTLEDNSTCYYTLPRVIINEINYNPCDLLGDDFDLEFVELLNYGDVTVDLSGYGFSINGIPGFTFPEGTEMAAGEFVLLVPSAVAASNYQPTGVQIFELIQGNFGNGGGSLSLADAFDNVVNAVDYNDAGEWPSSSLGILGFNYVESPDGGCATLEYIPEILELFIDVPTGNGNDFGGNWQASWVDGGTPGMANSSAFGCNNPAACNFNPNAILGNEAECEFDSCYGCTYVSSNNFDSNATTDDGSCEFTLDNPCPADLNGDGSVSTADLLEFLVDFGNPC